MQGVKRAEYFLGVWVCVGVSVYVSMCVCVRARVYVDVCARVRACICMRAEVRAMVGLAHAAHDPVARQRGQRAARVAGVDEPAAGVQRARAPRRQRSDIVVEDLACHGRVDGLLLLWRRHGFDEGCWGSTDAVVGGDCVAAGGLATLLDAVLPKL